MPVDAKAHNAKACAACRTQFERGEISLADYVWLTGDIERCEFMCSHDRKLRNFSFARERTALGASRRSPSTFKPAWIGRRGRRDFAAYATSARTSLKARTDEREDEEDDGAGHETTLL